MSDSFEQMLTGGHPNSLGRTLEVIDALEADPARLPELYACYSSGDEIVRLRTSNAFKRLWRAHPDWIVPYIDRFLDEVSQIRQPSAQWTLARMCQELAPHFTPDQRTRAVRVLQHNLTTYTDWIVLIETMTALAQAAKDDDALADWLRPHLEQRAEDPRKSVARAAIKHMKSL